ncbi:MAG TPA: hypothetical protein VH590_13890 [Ktedonobacterales bacterium]
MPDRSIFQPEETPKTTCPFCGSGETEFFSLFGSQLLTAQYYCRACHTPFEQIKTAEVLADAARRDLTVEGYEERRKS